MAAPTDSELVLVKTRELGISATALIPKDTVLSFPLKTIHRYRAVPNGLTNPDRPCTHCLPGHRAYFTLEVERRVTSWAPPSTMDTEDTRVSLALR